MYCWNASLRAKARLRTPDGRPVSVPLRLAAIEADHAGLAVVELAPPKHHAALPPRIRLRITDLAPPPLLGLTSTVVTVDAVTDRAPALVRLSPMGPGQRGALRLEITAWLSRDVFGLARPHSRRRRRWSHRRPGADDHLQLCVRVDLVAVGRLRSHLPVRAITPGLTLDEDTAESVPPEGVGK